MDDLPSDVLEHLAQHCCWRRIEAEYRVISRAARDEDAFLIVSGRARVTSISTAGRQVTVRDIGTGDWFGDFTAIEGQARSADVVAL